MTPLYNPDIFREVRGQQEEAGGRDPAEDRSPEPAPDNAGREYKPVHIKKRTNRP